MSVKLTLTRDFGSLEDLALVTADELREMGLLLRERILARTIRGEDAHGVPFAPYSERYREVKQREVGGAAVVNLQVSGAMLNDVVLVEIDAAAEKPFVRLGWVK